MAARNDRIKLEVKIKEELSVRQFAASEGLSQMFSLQLAVMSPKPDIDLARIVGFDASLRIDSGKSNAADRVRYWTGICSHMELAHIAPQDQKADQLGTSEHTYQMTVVPRLFLLSQRTNYRIFQHQSVVEIVEALLEEWDVERAWKVDKKSYPKLEYRVQYGESDLKFITRLLEEAGITFWFPDNDKKGSVLTLSDALHSGEARAAKLRFVDNPNESQAQEYITDIEMTLEVHPGLYTVRDFDPRKPAINLLGQSSGKAPANEGKYEFFHFQQGAFLAEVDNKSGDTPVADQDGAARYDPKRGSRYAQRLFDADRHDRKEIEFATNTTDLWPGLVFQIEQHPHPDLSSSAKLLTTSLQIQGSATDAWETTGEAVFANQPYRPAEVTDKPIARGVQSATVVGPKDKEIFTDEFGRVRVHFPWDRLSKRNDKSSCWIRVAQGWAGSGFGMVNLPRIGQEVLVSFLGGDPDTPIVTGRVFNATQPHPYPLPEHKTRSTWRSSSSPGSRGFNEVMFEDQKGFELVSVQAQRDKHQLVKNDETLTVMNDRSERIKHDELATVKKDRTEHTLGDRIEITDKERLTVVGGTRRALVGGDRTERTEGMDTHLVGKNHDVIVVKDKRERVDGDGHATIKGNAAERVGKKSSLEVTSDLHEKVGKVYSLAAKNVHIKAGPSLVLEAGLELTVKTSGGFLHVGPTGVTLKGTKLNLKSPGPGPGSGAGSSPKKPKKPALAKLKAPKPPTPPKLQPKPKPKPLAQAPVLKKDIQDKELTWLGIELVDEQGQPVPGERYEVVLTDGSKRHGVLDGYGKGKVEGIEPGTCKVSFPRLDTEVWRKA